jgi:hypothetical protein
MKRDQQDEIVSVTVDVTVRVTVLASRKDALDVATREVVGWDTSRAVGATLIAVNGVQGAR